MIGKLSNKVKLITTVMTLFLMVTLSLALDNNQTGLNYTFSERWKKHNAKNLYTIGFYKKFGYLAYAFEVYIIRKLSHSDFKILNKIGTR